MPPLVRLAAGSGGAGGRCTQPVGYKSPTSNAYTVPVPAGAEPADEQAAAASAAPAAAGPSALAAGQIDFSSSPKMVMIFTCSICETRAAKAFSKASYERGIVIVDCPGCHKKHLVADHLGWLGQKGGQGRWMVRHHLYRGWWHVCDCVGVARTPTSWVDCTLRGQGLTFRPWRTCREPGGLCGKVRQKCDPQDGR